MPLPRCATLLSLGSLIHYLDDRYCLVQHFHLNTLGNPQVLHVDFVPDLHLHKRQGRRITA